MGGDKGGDKGGDMGRIIRDFRKMLHFGKIPKKFGQIWRKFSKILAEFAKFWKKTAKISAIFNEIFEIRERLLNGLSFSPFRDCLGQVLFPPAFDYGFQKRCKGVHCLALGQSFPTSIY